MVELRPEPLRSWLCPDDARILGARLRGRIMERGRKPYLFVTMTYARKAGESGRDVYRDAQERRDVRQFVRRLGILMGESLTGRWICKLEFHEDGHPHWHILIDTPRFVVADRIAECWGRGFVTVKRASGKRIAYFCKYVSKSEGYPGWLYAEPARSVKIIRTSPGFFPPPDEDEEEFDGEAERRGKPCAPVCWTPIGERIRTREARGTVRDDADRYARIGIGVGAVAAVLSAMGVVSVEGRSGWMTLDAEFDQVVFVARMLESGISPAAIAAGEALDSTERRNPHLADDPSSPNAYPSWLVAALISGEGGCL